MDKIDRMLGDICELTGDALDDFVEAILGPIFKTLPAYAGWRGPDLADIRAGFRSSAALYLQTLKETRSPSEIELRRIRSVGAQRARQGLPRDSVGYSIDLAETEGYRYLAGRIRESLRADDALEAQERLHGHLAHFMFVVKEALLGGYDDFADEPSIAKGRQRVAMIDRLLSGRFSNDGEIRDHAAAVGVDLGSTTSALVLVPMGKQDRTALRCTAQAFADQALQSLVEGPIRDRPVENASLLVADANRLDAKGTVDRLTRLAEEHAVGVVPLSPARSLSALAEEYRSLDRRLQYVPAARRAPGLLSVRGLCLFHVVAGNASLSDQAEYVDLVFGRLLRDKNAGELLSVLGALVETDWSPDGTAELVHVHVSTVRRRMATIAQRTGLSCASPSGRYELTTALHLISNADRVLDPVRFRDKHVSREPITRRTPH